MQNSKTTILALSWRDIKAPKMGGAEVQTHEMLKRLNKEKYTVIHFSPMFDGAKPEEVIDGVRYIRQGNLFSCILKARKFYRKHHTEISYVLDQCNTHRFFTRFWVPKEKRIFYIHQLTREIWDINMKFPISWVGKKLETPMLKLNKNDWTITLSESTKKDLLEVGFDEHKIFTVPVGVDEGIYKFQDMLVEKENTPTFIFVGRYSKYKGLDTSVEALAKVKNLYPKARLWICGKKDESFVSEILQSICKENDLSLADAKDNCNADVVMWGFVTEEKKYELMKRAHALLFPSLREGWGIIVTEAGVLGTPSIVGNMPGTVDAVDYGNAGYLCEHIDSSEIANKMLCVIENNDEYKRKCEDAYNFSIKFKWENNGKLFERILETIEERSS